MVRKKLEARRLSLADQEARTWPGFTAIEEKEGNARRSVDRDEETGVPSTEILGRLNLVSDDSFPVLGRIEVVVSSMRELEIPRRGCVVWDENEARVLSTTCTMVTKGKKKLKMEETRQICSFPLNKEVLELFAAVKKCIHTFSIRLHLITDAKISLHFLLSQKIDHIPSKRVCFAIGCVVSYFFPQQVSTPMMPNEQGREEIDDFLHCISKRKRIPSTEIDVENWRLVPILRPYQMEAVRWMLEREREEVLQPPDNVPLAVDLHLPSGHRKWFYPATGIFSDTMDVECTTSFGGILCDEMGLGKTVEVIALILNHERHISKGPRHKGASRNNTNGLIKLLMDEIVSSVVASIEGSQGLKLGSPRRRRDCRYLYNSNNNAKMPDEWIKCRLCGESCSCERVHWNHCLLQTAGDFLCPECISKEDPLPIKATLIIAPASICHQWYEELKRHVRSNLSIDMYRGVVTDGYKHPCFLSQQDVVICSYETLQSELHFIDLSKQTRSLRRPKKFKIAPTPLLAVDWWRICLDEAQMVETSTSLVAQMCNQLNAVNRWCVTGTPIHRSVSDLRGVLCFLRCYPFAHEAWWNYLWSRWSNGDQNGLLSLLEQIFWRNAKKDVANQLEILSRSTDVSWINFTPLEHQFYQNTLEQCRGEMAKVLRQEVFNEREMLLSDLHKRDFDALIRPLTMLRRCVLHPALRDRMAISLNDKKKANREFRKKISAPELHTKMIKTTVTQCEEAQRSILMALNGLAGFHWLRREFSKAADHYRQALEAIAIFDHQDKTSASQTDEHGEEDPKRALIPKDKTSASQIDEHGEVDGEEDPKRALITKDKTSASQTDEHGEVDGEEDPKRALIPKDKTSASQTDENGEVDGEEDPKRALIPKTDKLQQIHTLYNLRQLLDLHLDQVSGRAISDDSLSDRLDTICSIYMKKYESQLAKVVEDAENIESPVKDAELTEMCEWLAHVTNSCSRVPDLAIELVERVRVALIDLDRHDFPITGAAALALTIENRWRDVCRARTKVVEDIVRVQAVDVKDEAVIATLAACHLRSVKGKTAIKRCVMCEADRHILQYEAKLFSGERLERGQLDDVEKANVQGEKRPTTLEVVIKAIAGFARSHRHERANIFTEMVLDKAKRHCELIGIVFKAELLKQKALWHAVSVMVAKRDELKMAMERMQLWTEDSTSRETRPVNAIEAHQIPDQMDDLRAQLIAGKHRRTEAMGRLNYLRHLGAENDSGAVQNCPICVGELGRSWLVLSCAHCICLDCYVHLTRMQGLNAQSVSCPICRKRTPNAAVCNVEIAAVNEDSDETSIRVEGDYSVKICSIVRRLLNILKTSDRRAKCLVFSSYPDILFHLVGDALRVNGIIFRCLDSSTSRQKVLADFRNNPSINVLLLSVAAGANGLNLTAANHVIFLEPLLNTADEAQAIGRIERIGQTKRPNVHYFLVRGSIEEQIHTALSQNPELDSQSRIGDLAALFGL